MAMPANQRPSRSVLMHGLGLLAFLLIGIAGGIIYLFVTTRIMGHRPSGFGNAAVLFVMPIWSLAYGVLFWLPVHIFHRRTWGAMSWGRAVLIAAISVFVAVMVFIGPGGFTTRGGAYLMNFFVIPTLIFGALTHHAFTSKK